MIKKIILYVPLMAGLLLWAGCASTSKASEEKSTEAKTFAPKPDRGTVFVYRTGRVVGAGVQTMVKVNGVDAGGTGVNTFLKWDLLPGTYTFSSATTESSAIVELNVEAGKLYFLRQDDRLGISSFRVTLQEVSESKGKSEIANCKLLVSSYVPE